MDSFPEILKGMKDYTGSQALLFERIYQVAKGVFRNYGYWPVIPPVLERTELFMRGIGETTDIVHKEMYTFEDRGGRSVTLRPEGTAGVTRAYIQARGKELRPVERLYYAGPMFRYERPQKGRLRQFHQLGIEFFGVAEPEADAEVITVANRVMEQLSVDIATKVNSIGCRVCRTAYAEYIRSELDPARDALCRDCNRRLDENPLRVLDCKVNRCREMTADLKGTVSILCRECRSHFDGVLSILDGLGIGYELDNKLVRGLDYYNRTVFELVSDRLGSQDAVCAGGRYDGLVSILGGPDTPAVGFAIGVERLMLLVDGRGKGLENTLFIIPQKGEYVLRCMEVAEEIRSFGIACRVALERRSLKALMRLASNEGFVWILIIGEEEYEKGMVTLKNMQDGYQKMLPVEKVLKILSSQGRNPL